MRMGMGIDQGWDGKGENDMVHCSYICTYICRQGATHQPSAVRIGDFEPRKIAGKDILQIVRLKSTIFSFEATPF